MVKLDSSPGVPYKSEYASNADLIADWGPSELYRVVLERLKCLDQEEDLWESVRKGEATAGSLIAANLVDPVRVFVKNEPHSDSKVKDGRWRLISSVSLIDQLVERMLCQNQNQAEIEGWKTCPSKPGLGLDDAGCLALLEEMRSFERPAEADVTGFDWSVQGHELRFEAEIRAELAGASKDSCFARVMRNRYLCMALSRIVLSDGTYFDQKTPGVQKSGSYNTSSTNSRIRWWLMLLVGARKGFAMGDDGVEEFVEGAPLKYAELGHKLKMYNECLGGEIEFCSTSFSLSKGTFVPKNWAKSVYALLNKSWHTVAAAEELLFAFREAHRHNQRGLDAFEEVLKVARWGPQTPLKE